MQKWSFSLVIHESLVESQQLEGCFQTGARTPNGSMNANGATSETNRACVCTFATWLCHKLIKNAFLLRSDPPLDPICHCLCQWRLPHLFGASPRSALFPETKRLAIHCFPLSHSSILFSVVHVWKLVSRGGPCPH